MKNDWKRVVTLWEIGFKFELLPFDIFSHHQQIKLGYGLKLMNIMKC